MSYYNNVHAVIYYIKIADLKDYAALVEFCILVVLFS